MREDNSCSFLVVEDDANEAMLLQRAFSKGSQAVHVNICTNINEAQAYLTGAGTYSDRFAHPLPSAILCDMNLGLDSGIKFVLWLRAHEELSLTPIIIMSGSRIPQWVRNAYAAGANSVITKPIGLEQFTTMIQDVANYWCRVVELPEIRDRSCTSPS